jgi:cytochrome P450
MFIYDVRRAILHDPVRYPEPEEFRPERYLDKDGNFRDDPAIALAFGVGKRICPGRHFVDATLFIVASSVISVFDIRKAKDENGHEIPVKGAMIARNGLIMYVSSYRTSTLPYLTDEFQDIQKIFSVPSLQEIKLRRICL